MSVVTIPASRSFLDSIAEAWIERVGLQGEKTSAQQDEVRQGGLILVPGRRAGRYLMEAFLRVLDGRAALLPSIMTLGDVDDEALFSICLDESFPPAVESMRRLAVLARLILSAPLFRSALGHEEGTIERVWPLAQALAELMDEAERNGVHLAERLPYAVEEEEFSHHWEQTLTFLQIVTEVWPNWLEEEGVSNPVARQVALLEAQAEAWKAQPLQGPVWAVGFVDGSAGVATVLKAVASLPEGCVILQGVDLDLEGALWEALPESHPQLLFRELLVEMEVKRSDIACWGTPERIGREVLLREALLPEDGLVRWGGKAVLPEYARPECEGLFVLPAEDPQQEALAIALILRDVAAYPGKTAALVTPDRALAQRVRAELLRFGIYVDDSAGEPLQRTPGAVFLRLVAAAFEAGLAPVALLSVLKHPLTALGMTPGTCRSMARLLEVTLLRGPAPVPGMTGLRVALREAFLEEATELSQKLGDFLDRLEEAFVPLFQLGKTASLPVMLEALVRTAEAFVTTAEEKILEGKGVFEGERRPGSRLWSGEDGAMLSHHLAALMVHTASLSDQPASVLENFLTVSMAGKALRGLRGYQDGVELAHPRISILGVLEARLLAFDTVILGGLNETRWPPATDPGPWLSRPMRRAVGLPSPERQIGASAHDFVTMASSARTVILSNTQRCDGSPVVPARWLVRLEAFLAGRTMHGLLHHPALFWQQKLDLPEGDAQPVQPPEPCPPVALRPRRLNITDIDTLKKDPYAIYARYVLRLCALAPLEEGVEHADYGVIVHKAMEQMLRRFPTLWPAHAKQVLQGCFEEALRDKGAAVRPALRAWWIPRLMRIADWVLGEEQARLGGCTAWRSLTEIETSYTLRDLPGGDFVLCGRADRIDLSEEASGQPPLARVFDYKTGHCPTGKDVEEGWASQIVLEAALLAEGAFKGLPPAKVGQLLYWYLSGGAKAGEVHEVPANKNALEGLVGEALLRLRGLLGAYDNPGQAYLSQPWAGHEPRYTQYAQLARVEEWRNAALDEG